MFQRTAFIAAAMAASAIAASPAHAVTGFSVGASVGSDGVGPDVIYKLNPFVNARAGFRYASLDLTRTIDDIDYDLDVGFSSGVVGLDVHPLMNGFRLSAGAYLGDRTFTMDAMPASPVMIGDMTFQPQEIGVITGDVAWNSAAPFLGIGFNNGATAIKRVGFQALIGAMYIGEPEVNLAATGGLLANDPTFLSELANEEDRLRDDLDDFPIHPILSLGLTVRF